MTDTDAATYRGYDRAGLDAQYDNQRHFPGHPAVIARYAEASAEARGRFRTVADVPYGPGPRHRIDLALPEAPAGAPVHVFLHGGAWRALSRGESLFPALALVPAGAAVAAPGFDLATAVPLAEMVAQCRQAVAAVARGVAERGGDPRRIQLCGHSSGAHLAGMVAATDWSAFGLPGDTVRSVLLVSGLYDLEPVRLSYRNEMLGLDDAAARALSPLHRRPRPGLPVVVAWAEGDTDEFRRQGADLAATWARWGADVEALPIAGRNHYDVVLDLADPGTALCRAALARL
jgi:arylformamidase